VFNVNRFYQVVLAAALFSSLIGALQLSEYAYLLEEKNPSTSFLYVFPSSCTGFTQAIGLSSRARQNQEFAEAVDWALKAREESELASVTAFFYDNVRLVDWGSQFLYQRWLSEKCFRHGSQALYYSVRSAKAGLKALDENVALLEKMTDPSYEGAAGGIKAALREASSFIEERDASGNSIGNYFERGRAATHSAWEGFDFKAPAANAVRGAAALLVDADSLLEREVLLNDVVKSAVASLEEEFAVYTATVKERRESADSGLKRLEAEELSVVSNDAFLAVGGASTAMTGLDFDSFAEDLRLTRRAYEDALLYEQSAKSFWAGKGSGYASKAINKLLESLQLLDKSIQRADASLERGVELERRIRERLNEEKAVVRALAENAEAYASATAVARLDALEEQQKTLASLGQKINYYLRQLNEVARIKAFLSSDSLEEEKAGLKARLLEAREIVALAEKDGLGAEWAKQALNRVEVALPSAGADALFVLADDVEKAVESIYAEALEKYGALLGGYYSHLNALRNALPDEQRAEVVSASAFFDGEQLNVERALGSLKELRKSLEGVESFVVVETPNLLRAHLTENLEIVESVDEPVTVGRETLVTTTISTKNDLPLSYDSILAIPVDAAGSLVEGNARFENKKLYLDSVWGEGASYYAVLERIAVVEQLVSSSRSQVFADQNGALFEETHSIDSEVAAWSVLLLDRDYAFEVLDAPANESAVAFRAEKGINKVFFSVFVAEPVKLTKSFEYEAETVTIRYEFENVAESLDSYSYSEQNPLNCSLLDLHEDGLEAEANEFMEVLIEDFAVKEKASLTATYRCESLEEAAQEFVENAEAIGLETSEALQLLEEGDYLAAVNAVGNKAGLKEKDWAGEALALAAESGEELAALLQEAAESGNVEKSLKSLANALLCKTCGEAKALYAVGDYLGAIESAWNEAKRVEQEEAGKEAVEKEKEARLNSFMELQGEVEAALADFEKVFEVGDDYKATRARSLQYQEALNHKNELEKKKSWLEKALADPSKYDLAAIESYLSSLEFELSSLEAALNDVKTKAEQEVALAEAQQKEFGNSSTQPQLNEARSLLESGRAYSAYVTANALRHDLLGVEAPNEQENWRVLLGAFGLVVLGALALHYWKPGHKKAKTVKP